MLDVHPPHQAAHSWRDFFIHIATIVIGLLIAIGLEQGVEVIHQHSEARETRAALRSEYEGNRTKISEEAVFWRRGTAALQNNLLVLHYLQQHPGTPQDKLPGTLYWGINNMLFAHAAWNSAQQTGIIRLLPQQEVTNDSYLYLELQRVEDASNEAWLAVNDAEEFTLTDPDPTHLTSDQVASVIALTEKALTKQVLQGDALANLNGNFADLPSTISPTELDTLRGRNGPPSVGLSAAHALTLARLRAAAPKPVTLAPQDVKK